jgi:hypothetical protein
LTRKGHYVRKPRVVRHEKSSVVNHLKSAVGQEEIVPDTIKGDLPNDTDLAIEHEQRE